MTGLRSPACHYLEHACFGGWVNLLVSRCAALSKSADLVALAFGPLSHSCRRAEHAVIRTAHLRGPAALRLVRQLPSHGGLSARTIRRRQALSCGCRDRSRISFRSSPLAFGFCFRPAPREGSRGEKKRLTLRLLAYRASRPQPPTTSAGFDLLHVPWLGRFLRWRHARLALQLPLALGAVALIFDGLRGPQIAAVNLAGVLPWIHWRGLLVLTLFLAGNFFCTACPFTLPRRLAGKWFRREHSWPHWLRGKWLALVLLAVFFWAYETFSLWSSPRETAWLVIGYFGSAFLVDSLFGSGSFCKYVCPIGQFNFACSLVSPLEIKVRSSDVCTTCQSHDCIRGRPGFRGCEAQTLSAEQIEQHGLHLLLRLHSGVPAGKRRPHRVAPRNAALSNGFGTGVGQFARRPDLAAVVFLLVFASLANAAGMVQPVLAWEDHLRLKLEARPDLSSRACSWHSRSLCCR